MKNLTITALLCFFVNLLFSQNSDSAQYYFKKGSEEAAIGHLAVAAKNFDKAIYLNPGFTEAYLANGKVNASMSRIYEANQNIVKAYELAPSNPEVIKEFTILSFNNHQFQKAIELAQKCTLCTDADRILGMSYYRTEDYGKAADFLQKALSKNDKDAEAAYTLGRTYLELENEKSAIQQYQKAITIDATKGGWMYELGLIYYNQNDYQNALRYFNKAAENGYNKTNDFYENYGFAQIYTGDAENGSKTLNRILERKPNNKELINNIANAMYETKRYEDALVYFQKLLQLNGNDASSLFMTGMTFQKMGQKEKGQKICDKAIEMDPSLARNRQKKDMPVGL